MNEEDDHSVSGYIELLNRHGVRLPESSRSQQDHQSIRNESPKPLQPKKDPVMNRPNADQQKIVNIMWMLSHPECSSIDTGGKRSYDDFVGISSDDLKELQNACRTAFRESNQEKGRKEGKEAASKEFEAKVAKNSNELEGAMAVSIRHYENVEREYRQLLETYGNAKKELQQVQEDMKKFSEYVPKTKLATVEKAKTRYGWLAFIATATATALTGALVIFNPMDSAGSSSDSATNQASVNSNDFKVDVSDVYTP